MYQTDALPKGISGACWLFCDGTDEKVRAVESDERDGSGWRDVRPLPPAARTGALLGELHLVCVLARRGWPREKARLSEDAEREVWRMGIEPTLSV